VVDAGMTANTVWIEDGGVYIPLPFAEDVGMRRLHMLILVLLFAGAALSQNLADLYKAGDEVDFAIERAGKVVGSQHATCTGWQVSGVDSLLVFAMETKTVYARGGKTFDFDVSCEAGYFPTGLPKKYEFTLDLLSTKVTHGGEFSETDYSGRTVRMGVTQPVQYKTRSHAVLFDNNFALQWEIATRPIRLSSGDSVAIETVIPQLNQTMVFVVHGMPDEKVDFGGQQVSAHVLKITPANQILYFDDNGRLLKAVDPVQQMTIRRLTTGEKATVAKTSWFVLFRDRFPIYGLLTLFAAAWFIALAYRDGKRIDALVMFVAGAALYSLSLQLLSPLQNAYFGIVIDPRSPSASIHLVMLGSAFLFAFAEELTKFICVFGRSLAKLGHSPRLGIALGAACGAGFALMQAANLLAYTPTGGAADPADVVQKFLSIGLNTTTGAMIGFLLFARRPWGFYLIPIGMKTLFDWLPFFVQKGQLKPSSYSVLTFVLTVLALIVLFLLYRRVQPTARPGRNVRSR